MQALPIQECPCSPAAELVTDKLKTVQLLPSAAFSCLRCYKGAEDSLETIPKVSLLRRDQCLWCQGVHFLKGLLENRYGSFGFLNQQTGGPLLCQMASQACTPVLQSQFGSSLGTMKSWPLTVKGHGSLLAGFGHFPNDCAFTLKMLALGKEETGGYLAPL